MAQSKGRTTGEKAADARNRGADDDGRFSEARHREPLQTSLPGTEENFTAQAAALRRRLRSSVDSTETIRADRAGDGDA
ncbi:MAG: hypothetical protein F4027_14605 [Rhodospirillaceae bacterium]|nr:hypothetical protein [Rhodospirillaceae bacterium]MYF86383.1 hypothetical protein [Rhodospirillaceae bacterium]MYH37733.1 hypothetical protein [Rhodospirillaceae bacterium]MYK13598.1 hypothetical protein [Rhodospirillaceae bacterium]MYK59760.1 hypothetical protein [Rhodospirillaceae bacterium]